MSYISRAIMYLLTEIDRTAEQQLGNKIADIVKSHSVGAACAAGAAGLVPGAAVPAAVAICGGFIWSMYYRINNAIGVPFSKNLIKSIGTAICTNVAMGYAGMYIIAFGVSFIPGVHAVNFLLLALATYVTTFASGVIYLNVLTAIAKSNNGSFDNVSEASLKKAADDACKNADLGAIKREAKAEYNEAKARGDINKNNNFDKEEGFK